MKRTIPLILVLCMGISMMLQFMIPHGVSVGYYELTTKWIRIVSAFALVLGTGSLIMHHTERLRRRREGWPYSLITLVALAATAVVGLGWGVKPGAPLQEVLFKNVLVPLNASMFAILAFYMASAAYRAFRARTTEAALLLVAAFIVMLGTVPLGTNVPFQVPALVLLTLGMASAEVMAVRSRRWMRVVLLPVVWLVCCWAILFLFGQTFGEVKEQVLSNPNMAAKRAIWFGMALGAIATSLKVILGIERGWLGGGKQ